MTNLASRYDLSKMRSMRNAFQSSLSDFVKNGSAFTILHSVPNEVNRKALVKTLYVLDSSYNPPTKAHIHLARSALTTDRGIKPSRILLLLAIKNADKAPKPAQFEHRLVMMTLMAEGLQKELKDVVVDIGVTTEPFYYKKLEVVENSGSYEGLEEGEQVHITGFDTIVRIFDKKYYPHEIGVLESMFDKGRLRVHMRDGDEEGQRRYLRALASGSREDEGIKKEWAERIEMVDPLQEFVSSTEARKCAGEGKGEGLEKYVNDKVKEYILQERLYNEENEKI